MTQNDRQQQSRWSSFLVRALAPCATVAGDFYEQCDGVLVPYIGT